MGKKISKKLTAGVALGTAVLAPLSMELDTKAYDINAEGFPEAGKTDEDGRLYGYYDADGKWQGNAIDIRVRTTDEHVLKVYRVSEDVDLSQRESYIVNANTIASKWCIKDATTRRVLAGVTINAKDADGNIVGTYVSDENGFIYYDDLPVGNYTLEAVSVPSGFAYNPETITRCEYVEDIVMDNSHKVSSYFKYYLSLPTSTYVLYLVKDYENYKGFTTASHDQYYNIGPQQLVLKMKGGIPLQWITLGNMDTTVNMGYYIYEVDKDGNNLGAVEGVKADVQIVNILTGDTRNETVGSGGDGMAMTKYDGKDPENYEYVFSLGDPPNDLAYYYPEDKNFAFSPLDGANGEELIRYIPVVATSSVNVKVYDQKTGEPIEGATVQLMDEDGNVYKNTDGVSEFKTGVADENGYNCVVDGLISGQYKIKVIAVPDDGTEGYAIPDLVVDITSEKGKVNAYEIPVAHYGYVKVNAINAETNEVITDNDISVNLYRGLENTPFKNLTLSEFGDYYRQGKILEDSSITVELVFPTGTYRLDKLLLNANNTSTEVAIDKTGAYHSQYGQDVSRDGLDLTYVLTVRTGEVTVTVQDKNTDEPIAGATVEIKDKDGTVVGTKTTDDNGEIKVDKLLPGEYTAEVTDPTDAYLPSDEKLPLTVVVDNNTKGVIELTRSEGYVKVAVVEKLQDDTTIPFEHVVHFDVYEETNTTLLKSLQTKADGTTDAILFDAANYSLRMGTLPEGYSYVLGDMWGFEIVHGATIPLTIQVERDRNDLGVKVVDDETDALLAGSEVTIYNPDGSVYGVATTNSSGQIEMAEVPTGTYTALVTNPTKGYNAPTQKQTINVTKDEDGFATIRLTRERADVTIKVEELATGNIVPNAIVEFGYYDVDGIWQALSGNDGTGDKTEFNLGNVGHVTLKNVPTDTYVARIKTPYPAHYMATDEVEKEFTVVENADNSVVLKLELKMVLLTFDVVDAETKAPLADTTVTITSADGDVLTGKTDENGFVSFGKVPANTYEYYASKTPTGYTAPAKESVNLDDATGDVHKTIELLRDKQSLTITVKDRKTGNIVPDTVIVITDADGKEHTVVADENGKVYLDNIPTGECNVHTFSAPEGYSTEDDIKVTVEKDTPAETTVFVSRDECTLNIYAVDAENNSIVLPHAVVAVYIVNADGTETKLGEYETDENGFYSLNTYTGKFRAEIITAPIGYTPLANLEVVELGKDEEKDTIVEATRDKGALKITSYDKGTGNILPGCIVEVHDENGTVYRVITDEDGEFVITDVPTGDYAIIIVEAPNGYTPATNDNVTVEKGEQVDARVDATRDRGTLKVTSYDKETGEILPGCMVDIIDENGVAIRTDTNENGEIILPEMPTGKYEIVIVDAPDGYTPATNDEVMVEKGEQADARVDATRDKGKINVVSTVEGTGEPLPFTEVQIIDFATGNVYATVTTDENGYYHLDDVPTGKYKAVISKAPDGYTPTYESEFEVAKNGVGVGHVEAARDVGTLKITSYIGASDKILPNATVEVRDEDGNVYATVTTDENGEAYITHVPTGNYDIVITDAPNGYTPSKNDNVTVEKGEQADARVEATRDIGQLVVTAYDEYTGGILAGVEITVTNGEHTAKGTTDALGHVTFMLPTGDYDVKLTSLPDRYHVTKEDAVSITKDGEHTAEVKADRDMGKIQVVVKDGKGTPEESDDIMLPDVEVKITDLETGDIYEATTDADGQMVTPYLPTGDYKIEVTGGLSYVYTIPAAKEAEVFYKDEPTVVVFNLTEDTNALHVLVVEKGTEKPLANVPVHITYNESEIGVFITDEYGYIHLPEVLVGSYSAGIFEEDTPEDYKRTDKSHGFATVTKDSEGNIILELARRKGDLNITVQDKDTQELISDAKVEIKDENGNKVADGVTDENGNLIIEDLPTGDYIIDVVEVPENYEIPEDTYAVVEDETATNVIIPVEKKKGDLDILVQDKDTDEPIPGAKVEIYDEDGNKVAEGTTDENGNLIVEDLPIGDYTIKVVEVPENYNKPDDKIVTIEDDKTTETVIEVEKKKGDLDILVKDKDTDEPIPGAKVEIYDEDGNKVAEGVTDENGNLIVEDLPIGDYTIKVVEVPENYNKPDDKTVTIEDDKTTETIIEVEKKKGDLDILIKDKDTDEPIPGAKVEIYDEDGNKVAEGTTDENGNLIIEDLPIGDYVIKVTEVPDGYNKPEDTTVTIEDEKTTETVIEVEKKKGDLDILVQDKDTDEPIPGAKVEIYDEDGNKVAEGTTDEKGNLIVEDLPIGDYTIKVVEVPENYNKPDDKIVTVEDEKTTDVVIEVEKKKGDLDIVIKDKDTDEPIPGADVVIKDKDGNIVAEGTTDENGNLIIEDLPIGDYIIEVEEVPDGYEKPDDKDVTIKDEETTETVIEVEKQKGDLDILVQDKDTDEPIPGAKVEIYDEDGNKVAEGTTDENGNLIVEDLPIGDYTIKVVEVPENYNKPDDKDVTIEDEKVTETVIEVEKKKGDLDIVVKDKDTDEPIPGAKVEIYDEDGNKVAEGTTDEDGNLVIEDLPIGDYVIKVTEVPDGYNKPEDTTVTIEDEKTTETIIEVEKKKGDLDILIQDKDTDEPIPGAKVEIYDEDGNKVAEGTTDEEGNLVIEDLPIGDYVIKVTEVPDGYNKPEDTTVTIEDEKTTETVIEVEKQKGDLDILVQDKDTDEPIPGAKVEIYDEDGNKVAEGTTDENGNLIVEDLPIGDYTIKVVEVPENYNKPDDVTVAIEDEKTTETVIEVEKKKGDLDILIQDKDTDEPIPGAKVEIYDEDGNKVAEGTTDEEGNLIIEDLPIGDYVIKVTEVPDGYNKPEDTTVTIEDEKTTETVIEVEKQKGDLNITVQDKDTKELIPDAKVEIYDEDGNKVAEGTTDENGNLIVEDLPIGDYTIKVVEVPDGYNIPEDTVAIVEDEKVTTTIIEIEKKKGDLDILIQDKDTKEPIPGAKVEIYDEDGNKVAEGTTDENGNLIVEDLPIGDYTIKVVEVPENYNKPDDKIVTVEDEKTTDVVIEVEHKKGDLDILVQDKDTKEPIPGAKVEIYDEDGNKVTEGTTDEEGNLILEDLPIGDYTIKVTEVPDGYNKPEDKTVTVEDEKVTETVIEIEKQKGDLSVTVRDKETQAPMKDTLVAIMDADGNILHTLKTDANGKLLVEDMIAGDYTIAVIEAPDGYTAPDAITATVKDKETTEVLIELTRDKGNLSITVEDKETKELLPNIQVVVKDETGKVVGEYTTNENGQVLVADLPTGKYTVETKDLPDIYRTPAIQTTEVEKGETADVLISLEKATGSLEMVAKQKDTSTYLEGVEFEVYDENGTLIGKFTSNKDGAALAETLVVGRYTVKVTKVPEGFKLPANAKEAIIVEDMETTVLFELEREEENVQTGDNSNIGLHAMLAGLSGVGIFASRKKKNKNAR